MRKAALKFLTALDASLLVVWVFFMFWWFPFQGGAYTVESINHLREFGWHCFTHVTTFIGLIIALDKAGRERRVPLLAAALIFVGTMADIFTVYEAFNMLPVTINLVPSGTDTLFDSAIMAAKVLSCLFIATSGLAFLLIGALYVITNDIMKNWAESLTEMMDNKKHKGRRGYDHKKRELELGEDL